LPTAAAGAPKPLEPNASGTISDWSTDPVADVKPVGPMDTKTGSAEHTPKSSDNRVVQADNLSNHIALLNLTQAPDALRVQRRLLSLGYRVGMPDGIWGVMSQVAIDEFRRKHRLSGKAKWDEETQAALFSEINLESGSDLEIEQTEATPKASSLGDKH
jgi:peptidoglycan hydrolase-like protein with peptidoglycan-binding domain